MLHVYFGFSSTLLIAYSASVVSACERPTLPALGRGRRDHPTRKMLGPGRLPVDGKYDKFQLQNHPEKRNPAAFFKTQGSFHSIC